MIQNNNNKKFNGLHVKKNNLDSCNVHLVHVNEDALLRDLFVCGKVDIYDKHKNTGKFITENNKK